MVVMRKCSFIMNNTALFLHKVRPKWTETTDKAEVLLQKILPPYFHITFFKSVCSTLLLYLIIQIAILSGLNIPIEVFVIMCKT